MQNHFYIKKKTQQLNSTFSAEILSSRLTFLALFSCVNSV